MHLCQYKKSITELVLYCIYIKKIWDTLTEYVPISTDGSKKAMWLLLFSKRLLNKTSIFTAEMSAILTALKIYRQEKCQVCHFSD